MMPARQIPDIEIYIEQCQVEHARWCATVVIAHVMATHDEVVRSMPREVPGKIISLSSMAMRYTLRNSACTSGSNAAAWRICLCMDNVLLHSEGMLGGKKHTTRNIHNDNH